MSSIFEHFQTHDPAKVALTDGERTVLYGDLLHEIDTRVDALFAVSCLAIALDNSVSWVLWDLAALKAGIPCVPMPPFFTDAQLYHSLQAAGVTHTLSPEGLHSQSNLHIRHNRRAKGRMPFTKGDGKCRTQYCRSPE